MKYLTLSLLFLSYVQVNAKNTSTSLKSKSIDLMKTTHKTIEVNNVSIFYREAGNPEKETLLLLHGFPSSSHMYRGVMERLATKYHLIAPDYPGFGFSDAPTTEAFEYTFDNIALLMDAFVDALALDSYYIMMQDYGGPIGFRMAHRRPEKVKGFIIQNANAYVEGLGGEWVQNLAAMQKAGDTQGVTQLKNWFMSLEGLKEMYLEGAKDPSKVDPISYLTDEAFLRREGINEVQTALFNNYGSNFAKYPEWQTYLKNHQPPALIIWGIHDKFFSKEGAEAYAKDLKNVETHLIDGGHFLLEEYPDLASELITTFIKNN